MSTPTVYHGVRSAESAGIFQDKHFWLAQRIPMRKVYIEMIKDNGGRIVKLEKNADYLIADHLRNDVPPGSCSYKFIEDSLDSGALQLEDRYRIGRDPEVPRPAGAGTLKKSSRVPFTKEDDSALASWLLSHTTHQTGNTIYQEFEAKNPRHTWQSWRDHWLKSLQGLPMETLQRMAASAQEIQDGQPEISEQSPVRQPEYQQRTGSIPRQSPGPRDSAAAAQSSATSANNEDKGEEEPVQDDNEINGHPASEEVRPPHSYKDQFYTDLKDFAQQQDLEIEPRPTVGGKTIELYDLAQAVDFQELPADEIDWGQVATELGYSRSSGDLLAQLQQCWEENLMVFIQAMADYYQDVEQSEAGREVQGLEDVVVDMDRITRALQPHQAFPNYPPSSSPESPVRGKRLFTQEEISFTPHMKRRKLDHDAEVPSTQDETLGVMRQPFEDQSPTRGRISEVKDSQEDSQDALTQLRTPTRKRNGFESQAPGHDDSRTAKLNTQGSSFDITPSQQLNFESRVSMSPENMGIDKGRRDQATSSPEESPTRAHNGLIASGRSPDLGTRSRQGRGLSTSPAEPPRPAKAVRRSLPTSFNGTTRAKAPSPPRPEPIGPSDDPDPRPCRDTPNFDTIEGWVEHYQAMGYPHPHVVAALKSTTMTPGGLASHVMESLHSGHGIPTHHEGVWTNRDDDSLRLIESAGPGDLNREATDAVEHNMLRRARRERARLVNKHGEERMALRLEFLEAQDQAART